MRSYIEGDDARARSAAWWRCSVLLAARGRVRPARRDSAPDLVWGVHGVKPGHLHKPRVAAFDAQDHLYLADLTDRIQVFDRDGTLPARLADARVQRGRAERTDRSIAMAGCWWPTRISTACWSIRRKGELLFQIGDGVQGTTPGRFGYPTDVVIDRAGNFYVAEYGENDRIQVFSPEGKWLRQWGGHGYEPGEFLKPRALAIDEQRPALTSPIVATTASRSSTPRASCCNSGARAVIGRGEMSYPYDLAIGPDHCLYVCEYGNHRVQKFTLDGQSLGTWGTPGRGPGAALQPLCPGRRQQGDVSVIDSNNHRVQRFRL